MDDKIIIKKARIKESNIIHQILRSSFQEFKDKYTFKAFEATVILPEKVEERIEKGIVWIAILNNEPIGTVSGNIKNSTFYIQGMAVLPKGRGKKIGYFLLKNIEEYARKNNCQNLLLSTTPYLSMAIRLYEKFGFEVINDPPYDLFKTPLFNMKKYLK